jgi:ketopantoate reductase
MLINLGKEQYLVATLRFAIASRTACSAHHTETDAELTEWNKLKEPSPRNHEATIKALSAKCKEQMSELMQQVQVLCEKLLHEQLTIASRSGTDTVLAELNEWKEVTRNEEACVKTSSSSVSSCEEQTLALTQVCEK